jgi:predicted nucleic acid-binding protein
VIYLDTSALVKLVFEEDESSALAQWVAEQIGVPKISSDLATVELLRTVRRTNESALSAAVILLDGIDLLRLDQSVVERAARVTPPELRSLDAIHLASAMSVKTHLTAFVAYDNQLCSAARDAGMSVESPR